MLRFWVKGEEIFSSRKTELEKIIDLIQKHDHINIDLVDHKPTSFTLSDTGRGKYEYSIKVWHEGECIEKVKFRWFVMDVAGWILNYKKLCQYDLDFEVTKEEIDDKEYKKLMETTSYKRVKGALRQRR